MGGEREKDINSFAVSRREAESEAAGRSEGEGGSGCKAAEGADVWQVGKETANQGLYSESPRDQSC